MDGTRGVVVGVVVVASVFEMISGALFVVLGLFVGVVCIEVD